MRVISKESTSVSTDVCQRNASEPLAANNSAVKAARVGAVAFALGLFLVGPQTAGVALADASENNSGSTADANSGKARSVGAPSRAKTASEPTTPDDTTAGVGGGVTRSSASGATRTTPPNAATGTSEIPDALVDAQADPLVAGAVAAPDRTKSGVRSRGSVSAPPSSAAATGAVVAAGAELMGDAGVSTPAPAVRIPVAAVLLPAPSAAANAVPAGAGVSTAVPVIRIPVATVPVVNDPNQRMQTFFTNLSEALDTLPAPQATEFFQGVLLMMRRSFFNQAAVASPVQTSFDPENLRGLITGGVGAEDPEGEALTYKVVKGPQYGTVEVGANGAYTYTPGDDFTGQDSFSVTVTSAGQGINLLDLRGGRSTTVEVLVGTNASTNPFVARNIRDVALYMGDVPITVRVEKKNVLSGVQTATLTLKATGDAPVTWLDDQGHIGQVSIADLATQWAGFTSAGSVRMGVNFTLEDDTVAALILTSVTATRSSDVDADAYVFSGTLASDPANGAGVDSYYDITGGSQKTAYENFRSAYLKAAQVNGVEFAVEAAEIFADSYSLSDYKAALKDADLGTVIEPGQDLSPAAAAEAAKSPAFNGDVLTKVIGFAKTGGKAVTGNAFNSLDPIFYSNPSLQPKCMASRSCDGSFYPVTMYSVPKPLVEKLWDLGGKTTLNLSFDMGYTVYGYAYVPSGVWAKLKPSNYAGAVVTGITTGPSLGVMLGGSTPPKDPKDPKGPVILNPKDPITLIGPASLYSYPPFFDVSGRIDAHISATFTTADAQMKKLGAHLYQTFGLLTTYNVGQTSGFALDYTGVWPPDMYFDDFKAVTGVTISPTLTPSLTASTGLLTPASTPIIGQVKLLALDLSYLNPLSLDLTLSTNAPDLRFNSVGQVRVSVGALPRLVSWLKYTTPPMEVYRYTSDNLWPSIL
jgi:hypothetical protein